MKYLFLVGFFLFSIPIFSQNLIIEGEVIRDRLLTPIARQKITMYGVSGVHPVYSNASGHFVLELPENTKITHYSKFVVNGSLIDTSQYEYSPTGKFIRIKLKDQNKTETLHQGKAFYFHVTLKDKKETALSQRNVSIDGTRYITNREGKFSLTAIPLDPDIYDVVIKSNADELKKQVEEQLQKDEKEQPSDKPQSVEQVLEIVSQIAKKDIKDLTTEEAKLLQVMKGYVEENTTDNELLAQIERITAAKDSLDAIAQARQKEIETQQAERKRLEELSQKERQDFRRKFSAVLGGFFLVIIIAFIILGYSQKTRKQKKEIEKQSKIIEQANQEIMGKNSLLENQKMALEKANFYISEKNQLLEEQKQALEDANNEISEKHQKLEQTLNDLKTTQTQLIHSERMASLGNMTAGIAHEINNPINFVYSNTETLDVTLQDLEEIIEKYEDFVRNIPTEELKKSFGKLPPPEELLTDAKDCIADIREGAVRTIEIVKSLNNFSRHNESSIKKADLHENLDSTLVILRNQYKDKVDIVKNYGKIPLVECFLGNINQVFMNLISNAVQAIEDKGKITISTQAFTKENIEFVKISVTDTGKGMSEETLKRVFEPYFTTKVRGVGLGLAITFGIIDKHNGKIEVESQVGKGTTFHVTLPVIAQIKEEV